MSLFNLFNRKREASNDAPASNDPTPVLTQSTQTQTEQTSTQTQADSSTEEPLTVTCASGWPIDVIYGYLHKNFEQKGYDDALLNSNLKFRDMNMSIIRNRILMMFREVNLAYDSMREDLETRIDTCSAAGLLTTVAELDKRMAVIQSHKSELERLETDFRNNANEASVPLMSYECGFLRAVSTIAMATPARVRPLRQSAEQQDNTGVSALA